MPICQGLECILLKKVGTRRAGRHRKSLNVSNLERGLDNEVNKNHHSNPRDYKDRYFELSIYGISSSLFMVFREFF